MPDRGMRKAGFLQILKSPLLKSDPFCIREHKPLPLCRVVRPLNHVVQSGCSVVSLGFSVPAELAHRNQ